MLDITQKDVKGLPLTVRACYIIDPDRVIKAVITYPASTGRNFAEIIRCIDSLQLTSKFSVATPVNWTPGSDVIVNYPLSDAQAEDKFGKGGFKVRNPVYAKTTTLRSVTNFLLPQIINVPSEADGTAQWLPAKHYLRTLPDPSHSTDVYLAYGCF